MAVRLWTLEKLGDVAALRGVLKKTVEGKQQNQTVHHARPKRAPATAHRFVGVDRCEAASAAGDGRRRQPRGNATAGPQASACIRSNHDWEEDEAGRCQ